VQFYLDKEHFTVEVMAKKSSAAMNLANWAINIVKFNYIFQNCDPLMKEVAKAEREENAALEKLEAVLKNVADINQMVADLNQKMQEAQESLDEANRLKESKLALREIAETLIGNLTGEKSRWFDTVQKLKTKKAELIGNVLVASAFVGYISPFPSSFRKGLWQGQWIKGVDTMKLPYTEGLDPVYDILTDNSTIASWNNEGLPSDRVSIENAAITTSCARWPLMVDPQLQGVKWTKQRYQDEEENFKTIQLTQKKWLNVVTSCLAAGSILLIESIPSEIDAILDPVLSRAIINRGKSSFVNIGGEEFDYDKHFKLILQSKLPNPHYRPEVSAQCTILNFIVTPDGLEDQILAVIVGLEKPELEEEAQNLIKEQNDYATVLAELEETLLQELSKADSSTILYNKPLMNTLVETKLKSKQIEDAVSLGKVTQANIDMTRELYRPAAAEGSRLFFLIISLCFVEHMYQFSLDAFTTFLTRAIDKAAKPSDEMVKELQEAIDEEKNEDRKREKEKEMAATLVSTRANLITDNLRIVVFRWVNRGLFERHKLLFCALLTFGLFMNGLHDSEEEFNEGHFDFLMRGSTLPGIENEAADWLPQPAWDAVQKLITVEGFESFSQNLAKDAPNRFKEWFNELAPENAKLPLDWKKLEQTPFQKLMVVRCLRPDRMVDALTNWILVTLPEAKEYLYCDGSASFNDVLQSSFDDANNITPVFFILSPGADPVKAVELMGKKMKGSLVIGTNYHNVAMGQGQDVVAMAKLELGHKEGHWVMLQNVHLMPRWCRDLEKQLDNMALEGSHPDFRLFLSADPDNGIPIGILDRSIKLTNEPPQGLKANMKRAFANFEATEFNERDAKVKSILYSLSHFHSIMLERKKFGPMGYNMMYPFATGDLVDSASVLYNYLGEGAGKVPWADLKYIFGEIMYGGHIVDDWDRVLCATYLDFYMREEVLDEMDLAPYTKGISYKTPPAGDKKAMDDYIEQAMPTENPLLYGFHNNAQINFQTMQCTVLFSQLVVLRPQSGAADAGAAEEDDAGMGMDSANPMQIAEQNGDEFIEFTEECVGAIEPYMVGDVNANMFEDEGTTIIMPYQFSFLLECAYMKKLLAEMQRSLAELKLGFKGELTMSDLMEKLADSLFSEKLPPTWAALGFPSLRPLVSWKSDVAKRCAQLSVFTADCSRIAAAVDISKFFNPSSFLTAIKQVKCKYELRANADSSNSEKQMPLDKLDVLTEMTKKSPKQVDAAAKVGSYYVFGMFLEGARWDMQSNQIEESRPKEMFSPMPVMIARADAKGPGSASEKHCRDKYICPVYAITTRRPYYIFPAQMRTKEPYQKWILAGVAIILDIGI
jgi:dynein heavy chain